MLYIHACPTCRNNVDKRETLENLDLILLCFDEIVDGGCAIRFLILVLSSSI